MFNQVFMSGAFMCTWVLACVCLCARGMWCVCVYTCLYVCERYVLFVVVLRWLGTVCHKEVC